MVQHMQINQSNIVSTEGKIKIVFVEVIEQAFDKILIPIYDKIQ